MWQEGEGVGGGVWQAGEGVLGRGGCRGGVWQEGEGCGKRGRGVLGGVGCIGYSRKNLPEVTSLTMALGLERVHSNTLH